MKEILRRLLLIIVFLLLFIPIIVLELFPVIIVAGIYWVLTGGDLLNRWVDDIKYLPSYWVYELLNILENVDN